MHHRGVVPEHHVAGPPAVGHAEFVAQAVIEDLFHERSAFGGRQAFDMGGVGRVDVDRLAAGLGMGADHRMHTRGRVIDLALDQDVPLRMGIVVDGAKPRQALF